MGSWSYPEEGYVKIFGVPLYSGFMYASVASYLCEAWRRLQVELIRWWLSALVLIVFWRSWVAYEVNGRRYRMPLALSTHRIFHLDCREYCHLLRSLGVPQSDRSLESRRPGQSQLVAPACHCQLSYRGNAETSEGKDSLDSSKQAPDGIVAAGACSSCYQSIRSSGAAA